MKPLTTDDLIPYEEYERRRDEVRRRIIALKARRRIAVGDQVTLVFENRDTIQFQIQEMVRAERIVDPGKVQDELTVYNALLPGSGELSATLFIELTDQARIKDDLDRFQGIDRAGRLVLRAGTDTVPGIFEEGHSKEDKISAVHFVTFRLSPSFIEALADPARPVSIDIQHPGYQQQAEVSRELREEWLADLGRAGVRGSRS